MRRLALQAVPATLLMATIACGGRSNGASPSPTPTNGSMSVVIDGSIWPAMSVTTQVNDFRTILAITGSDAAGSSFKLTFPIADGTGTKVIGQGNAGHAQLTFGAQIWW